MKVDRKEVESLLAALKSAVEMADRIFSRLKDEPAPTYVSARIEKYAKHHGWEVGMATQVLAYESGVSVKTLERWADGSQNPRRGTVAKVNEVLVREGLPPIRV